MIHILLFPLLAPCWHHFQADNTNICSKHCCPGMGDVGLQTPELWVLFERNWPPISPVKVFIAPPCHGLAEAYFLQPRRSVSALNSGVPEFQRVVSRVD